MLKRYNRLLLSLFLVSDIFLTNSSFLLAYHIRFTKSYGFFSSYNIPPLSHYKIPLLFISFIWIVNFYFMGLYESKRGKSQIDEILTVIKGVFFSVIILLSIGFFYRKVSYSRLVVLVFLLVDIFLLSTSRIIIRYLLACIRKKGYNIRRILIYGAGNVGEQVLNRVVSHPQLGLHVVGFMDDSPEKVGTEHFGVEVLGGIDKLADVLREKDVDQLYLALPLKSHDRLCQIMKIMAKECASVKYIPDIFEFITLEAGVEDLDGLPIVNISQPPIIGFSSVMKRIVDVVGSLVLIALFSPLMLMLAIAVKLSSAGKVFYTQKRMGIDGKEFNIIKYRTMLEDAEGITGPVWASKNDDRRTPIGKFLRKSSLDELPQLLNVLKGEMSLVGPRPERPNFVHQFREELPQYMLRHKVKAGITGWAQVNGWRGNTCIKKRVEHDIFYIENWSFSFDFKIIWLTLWEVLAGEHAY